MWKATDHKGSIRVAYITKQGTVAAVKSTRYGNLRAAKESAVELNLRARDIRKNPGKYGHCPECALSAGHGTDCPVGVEEAEQRAVKQEEDSRDEQITRVARAIFLADSLSTEEDARDWDTNRVDRAQRNAYVSMAEAAVDELLLDRTAVANALSARANHADPTGTTIKLDAALDAVMGLERVRT